MATIQLKDLTMIFGDAKSKKIALEMLDQQMNPKEISEKTNTTIALNRVSFSIEDKELFVIVGLSGSGKSTLIRCLNLLNKPTSGDVLINGESIISYDRKTLLAFRRKKISMVFQHFGLLSHRSIIRNIEYGLEIQGMPKAERRLKALEALKIVGLEGCVDKKPHELSGGMKQRVGLARAIVTEPEILLMDEPYSALDPLIRRDMQNELLTLEDYINRTIVFITHDMNEAFKMGDRIALMKDGKVVQIGTPNDFFNHPADDYVSDFIADVDKTQIFKVRNIMTKVPYVAFDDELQIDVFSQMIEYQLSYCYVTQRDNTYIGYITNDSLDPTSKSTIENLIKTTKPVLRNTYLKSLWTRFESTEYSLPVIDTNQKFRGEVTKDALISALA